MKKFKKIVLGIIAILIIVGIVVGIVYSSKKIKKSSDKIQIVASNFASYDFLRAITKGNDNIELTFLLGPGKDAHSYDPTANDLITIQNAKLFVYIGGEMEKWTDKVLNTIDTNKCETMCIAEFADTIDEEKVDGAESEDEEEEEEGAFDEHIWTSPSNAIKMCEALEEVMEQIDSSNKEIYRNNSDNYIKQINDVDREIQEIVNNKKRDRLVFGDKMPMQYFMNYYGLKVSAAFNGCSTEVDPSASTMVYLENVIKDQKIPVVLYIELNNGRVAETIARETESKAMQIQTLHNVSLDDFKNEETWVSLMRKNVSVLKEALQ